MATTPKSDSGRSDYQLPVVHIRVPERVANMTFWLGLTGAVIGGAVELPVAAAVVAGVAVARHRGRRT
jgi:hypothetical protein